MKIDIIHNQIQGDRDYQQDSVGERDIAGFKLLVLADGMGGYFGGEIASKIVVDTFMKHTLSDAESFLEEALDLANEKILEYKELHDEVSNMGTTLIAVLMNDSSYRWISVGDSPLYLIQNNSITRINENHSVAGMLDIQVQRGEISEEKALTNRNRHQLTSALVGGQIPLIEISKPYKFEINDRLILSSDGIETLSEDEILSFMNSNTDIRAISENILKEIESKEKKNQDNATLIIASPLVDIKIEKKSKQKNKHNVLTMGIVLSLLTVSIFSIIWKLN